MRLGVLLTAEALLAFVSWMCLPSTARAAAGAPYRITTLASSSGATLFDGLGVAVDPSGNVYSTGVVPGADGTGGFPAILMLNSSGVTRVVGTNTPNPPFPGCGDPATQIGMTDLGGVAVDTSGNIYVAQSGNGRCPADC